MRWGDHHAGTASTPGILPPGLGLTVAQLVASSSTTAPAAPPTTCPALRLHLPGRRHGLPHQRRASDAALPTRPQTTALSRSPRPVPRPARPPHCPREPCRRTGDARSPHARQRRVAVRQRTRGPRDPTNSPAAAGRTPAPSRRPASIAANVAHSFLPPRGGPALLVAPNPAPSSAPIVWPCSCSSRSNPRPHRVATRSGAGVPALPPVSCPSPESPRSSPTGTCPDCSHTTERTPIVHVIGPLAVDGLMIMATGALVATERCIHAPHVPNPCSPPPATSPSQHHRPATTVAPSTTTGPAPAFLPAATPTPAQVKERIKAPAAGRSTTEARQRPAPTHPVTASRRRHALTEAVAPGSSPAPVLSPGPPDGQPRSATTRENCACPHAGRQARTRHRSTQPRNERTH